MVRPILHVDRRGAFAKPFAPGLLDELDPTFSVAEIFWSTSGRGVVRGMHYQRPPASVAKLVWCTSGRILDVVVDLRPASFGRTFAAELRAEEGTAMFVPHGCAHGFLALEDATVVYAQSGPFSGEHDAGVHWRSIDVEWPELDVAPILSDRDEAHPPLRDANAGY